MRYISEINSFMQGNLKTMSPSVWLFEDQVAMTVCDTSSSAELVVAASDIPSMSVLGFSDAVPGGKYGVVCLSDRAVILHKFAKVTTVFGDFRDVALEESDACIWNLWQTNTDGICGDRPAIVIHTLSDIISASGRCGSVIGKQVDFIDEVALCTLYDIIGMACRELGENLLRYSKIQFYSRTKSYVTTIELDQSHEAKVFYTKMYLDVVRL